MAIFTDTTRGFCSPMRYYQGANVMNGLGQLCATFGDSAYVIIDTFFFTSLSQKLGAQFMQSAVALTTELFGGQITTEEIERCLHNAKAAKAKIIVGIGGGKTLDTAKDVANHMGAPVIIMPTTASTDAPTSGLSVVYKANGEHSHVDWYKKNPEIILVDSEIIASAPLRFLVAGIGDALATYFEARAYKEANSTHPDFLNGGGIAMSRVGMAIARECFAVLMEKGKAAVTAVKNGVRTSAVEDIIEANTLLSGLGFENTGCAGAHSIANGLTVLPENMKNLHGEGVAFGTIVQLIVENGDEEEINAVLDFCIDVGLPICLNDLHIPETKENARAVASASMHSFWDTEPVTVTEDDVFNAIIMANGLAKEKRGKA